MNGTFALLGEENTLPFQKHLISMSTNLQQFKNSIPPEGVPMTQAVFADAKCTLVIEMDELAGCLPHIAELFNIPAKDCGVLISGSDACFTILRAKLETNSRWIRIMGGSMAVSPRASAVALRVVNELGLEGCERQLIEVPGDLWQVAKTEMLGQMPDTLFHGTSTKFLQNIRQIGLSLNMPSNWDLGINGGAHRGTPVVSLAAEANVAAMHAYETAEKIGGDPTVLQVTTPSNLFADHDVMLMIGAIDGTDQTAMEMSTAVGLFATPDPVPPDALIAARAPTRRTAWDTWKILS
ncbi:hypothetical protein [Sphingomonas sp. MMS24-J13]|uniref:hypothetical protein n=1 Tax=Sphingomonas sp. MMS24-J13 TaxID=3238686 RepID=UPI00384C3D1E